MNFSQGCEGLMHWARAFHSGPFNFARASLDQMGAKTLRAIHTELTGLGLGRTEILLYSTETGHGPGVSAGAGPWSRGTALRTQARAGPCDGDG